MAGDATLSVVVYDARLSGSADLVAEQQLDDVKDLELVEDHLVVHCAKREFKFEAWRKVVAKQNRPFTEKIRNR
jgi:hypothetical protein